MASLPASRLAARHWSSCSSAGILGAVSLAALAGARRTESAYGRYLASINASDRLGEHSPGGAPGTSLIARVSDLPGIRSSAAWLGLDANPVVHGRVDDFFVTDALTGSLERRDLHPGQDDRLGAGCPGSTPPTRSR